MTRELQNIIDSIPEINRSLEPQIQKHLNDLTHPPGSLGRLEEIAMRYCKIQNTAAPVSGKKIIFTFAADHGVADENISIAPKEVTRQMVLNMLAGGAGVNVLSRHAGIETRVVDIGVDYDFGGCAGLIDRKVRKGTANLRIGPAMSLDEAGQAVLAGARLAIDAKKEGAVLLGTGEMGIGNTTPSSALFAALLPCPVETVTGRGTGIGDETLRRKIQIIKEALEINRPQLNDPMSALAAVGGLEIAGICGLCLGSASVQIPVAVDGFISSAGAFIASKLNPRVTDYLFFSHRSAEAGHDVFLQHIKAEPLLDLGMRLGEGTGAALAINLIEASVKIYNEMATFSGARIATCNKGKS